MVPGSTPTRTLNPSREPSTGEPGTSRSLSILDYVLVNGRLSSSTSARVSTAHSRDPLTSCRFQVPGSRFQVSFAGSRENVELTWNREPVNPEPGQVLTPPALCVVGSQSALCFPVSPVVARPSPRPRVVAHVRGRHAGEKRSQLSSTVPSTSLLPLNVGLANVDC
jgi:hypothetical protein